MKPFDLVHTPYTMTQGQREEIWHTILSTPTRLYEVLGVAKARNSPGFYAQNPLVLCQPDSVSFLFKQYVDRAVSFVGLSIFVEDKFDILPKVYEKIIEPSYDRGVDPEYYEEYSVVVPQYLMLADSTFDSDVHAVTGDVCYLTYRVKP